MNLKAKEDTLPDFEGVWADSGPFEEFISKFWYLLCVCVCVCIYIYIYIYNAMCQFPVCLLKELIYLRFLK